VTTFAKMARLGHGTFATIPQDGGVQQIATPYDARLGQLATVVDGTTVFYGKDDARAAAEGTAAVVAGAAPAARAERAAYYAETGKGRAGDLIGDPGDVDILKLDQDQLPGALRGLDAKQLAQNLADRKAARAAAEAEIRDLSAKRETYLKAQSADGERPSAFDDEVNAAVDRALAK
jgi:hypothetical protein